MEFRKRVSESLRQIAYFGLQRPIVTLCVVLLIVIPTYILIVISINLSQALRQIADSIFGGTIASLVTYAIVRYFFIESESYGVRRWFNFGPTKVWIVPTYLEHPYHRSASTYYVTPPFDAQAAGVLTNIARDIGLRYPMRKIIGSHRDPRDFIQDNLLTLCLPDRNVFSRLFLGILYDIHYRKMHREEAINTENYNKYIGDSDCQLDYFGLRAIRTKNGTEWQIRDFTRRRGDGEWLRSSININISENIELKVGVNQQDYAMVIRIANPFNPSASLLIIFGLHGIGTFGASIHILQHSNKLFEQHRSEDQLLVLRINYRIPDGLTNYVDAELLPADPRLHARLTDIDFDQGDVSSIRRG